MNCRNTIIHNITLCFRTKVPETVILCVCVCSVVHNKKMARDYEEHNTILCKTRFFFMLIKIYSSFFMIVVLMFPWECFLFCLLCVCVCVYYDNVRRSKTVSSVLGFALVAPTFLCVSVQGFTEDQIHNRQLNNGRKWNLIGFIFNLYL